MKRSHRTLLLVMALLGLTAWVGSLLRLHRTTEQNQAGPGGRPTGAEYKVKVERSAGKISRLGTFQSGTRTAIPRFVLAPLSEPDGAVAGGVAVHPRSLRAGGGGLEDKRPQPRAPLTADWKARVQALLNEVHEGANRCLQQWSEQDDSLASGVLLGIDLDAGGLEQVWLQDRARVPSGPLACLSDAVYPLDWSGLVDKPMSLTLRMKYDDLDGGG